MLTTGSTLLNLACSDDPNGGLSTGKVHLFVGDAAAGKTFLAISILAEASRNPAFAEYDLVYDNVEDGCQFDLDRLFGKSLRPRLQSPRRHPDGSARYSETLEEFYYGLDERLTSGKPVIYVLDSMDGLISVAEEDHFQKSKRAHHEGKEAPGTYGMSKAKQNSALLRRTITPLRDTNSVLIILAQTRADLSYGPQTKTRAGGHSLSFYATVEIWASVKGVITKTIAGKKRPIGTKTLWRIRKNRMTGRGGEIGFDIYPSYGIDDLGGSIDFLVDEGWWSLRGRSIDANELGTFTRDKLIAKIEKEKLQGQVSIEVAKCWKTIREGESLGRPGRYDDDEMSGNP